MIVTTNNIKPIYLYSFYTTVNSALKNEDLDCDFGKLYPLRVYLNSPDFLQNNFKRISSEIYSNHYNFYDYKLAVLHSLLFNKNCNLKNINIKNVQKIKKLYTNEMLQNDREQILSLKEDIPFDDISLFFKFNSNDVSFLYEFMEKELLSPMFWLRYSDDKYFKNNTFIETDQHKQFRFVMKLIKRVVTNS